MSDLQTLPGIGSGLAAELRAVGVRDVAALRSLGAVAAAGRLAELGTRDEARAREQLQTALGNAAAPDRAPLAVAGVVAVELAVGDLPTALEHYASRLGLVVRETRPGLAVLATQGGGPAPEGTVPDGPAVDPAGSGAVLVLRVTEATGGGHARLAVADVAAAAARLREAGLAPSPSADPVTGAEGVEVVDAWGNVLALGPRRPAC